MPPKLRNGPKCDGSFKSPIIIPNNNLKKCSLLCSIEFIYKEMEWNMNAVQIDNNGNKLLRFYVKNSKTMRTDLQYNGVKYQLEFIEFYLESLHKTQSAEAGDESAGSQSSERYDVEMVMYHRGFNSNSSKNIWLNLSIFVTPMYTFSISQDFFYQLIHPLCSKSSESSESSGSKVCFLDGSKSYMNVTSTTPTTNSSCVLTGSKSPNGNNSRCIKLSVSQKWNPYQALPYKKSFYIYKGDFPYSPCAYGSGTNDDIIWVIMENTVPMHYSEYEQLKNIYKGNKYKLNIGQLYKTYPLNDRPIYYNDGTYVQGNMDRDKFYVKCTKKEQGPSVKNLSFSPSNTDDVTDGTSNSVNEPDYKSSSFVFYKPPSKYMPTIMLCFILSLFLFFMFYYFSVKNNDNNAQTTFLVFMAIAVCVMFILSFVMVSLNILMSFISILVYPWIVMAINSLDNSYGEEKPILHYFIVVLKFFLLFYILTALVIVPLTSYNPETSVQNNYFYLEDVKNKNIYSEKVLSDFTLGVVNVPDEDLSNASFYIGINMDVEVNFAGYQLFYRNDYIISQGKSNNEYNLAGQALAKAYSPSESVSMPAIIDKFHKIDTTGIDKVFSPIETTTPMTSLKKNGIMLQILQKYNENMKSNHAEPPQKFISAAWYVLKRTYQSNSLSLQDMIANIEIELQKTMCYLRQNKDCT